LPWTRQSVAVILDTRVGVIDEKAYKAMIEKVGCQESAGGDDSLQMLRDNGSSLCRAEIIRIFKALGVEAILYQYDGSESIANCRSPHDVALNVISASAIDESKLSYYSNTREFESNPSQTSFIARLFGEAELDNKIYSAVLPLPTTIKPDSLLSSLDYEKFKADLLWKCGPVRPGETLPSDFSEKIALDATKEDGYQMIVGKAAQDYAKRENGSSFEVTSLRAILRLQYRASKMAKDDSKFTQWLEAYRGFLNSPSFVYGNSKEARAYLAKISALLDEETTRTEKINLDAFGDEFNRIRSQKINYVTQYVGILPYFLLKAGYGPRLTGIISNFFVPYPIVVGAVPVNPAKDYTQLMNVDRRVVIDILRQCTTEYNDPQKTNDEINQGECGIVDLSSPPVVSK